MGLTIAQKLIKAHLVEGEMKVGTEIGLRIDQTLTQDATGTMAYLEFEAMGVDRVKTEKSVAYIDHNTLQTGFENADDHRYIQSVTKNTVFISAGRVTVFATRYTLKDLVFRAKLLSVLTAIHLPAAVSVCLLWVQADLMLLLLWAAARIIFQCRK